MSRTNRRHRSVCVTDEGKVECVCGLEESLAMADEAHADVHFTAQSSTGDNFGEEPFPDGI